MSGEGVGFFNKTDFSNSWTNQTIGRKEETNSLIAFSTYDDVDKIHTYPDALDLLGDFPEAQTASIAEETTMFEGVSELERILGLGALRPMRNAEDGLFLKSSMPLNTVVFRGHTKRRKGRFGKFKTTQAGRGHWGKFHIAILLFINYSNTILTKNIFHTLFLSFQAPTSTRESLHTAQVSIILMVCMYTTFVASDSHFSTLLLLLCNRFVG